ncbi:hypothetical protein SDC9_58283 [bioreactor metagenome]|uniref:Uncharacterized protein n=1 Tax=bioreactor metagenome TaxID=1076179 RepID=A0A644X6Y6_9ZZZZ
MCLSKNALVLNQDGLEYTADNIDPMLLARHTARKIRSSGGKVKGPKKRTPEQDKAFEVSLEHLLDLNFEKRPQISPDK